MKLYVKSTIVNDEDEWTPFRNGTYCVTGGPYSEFVKNTDNPKLAIKYWFQANEKYPSDCAISCQTREQAIALCKVATADFLTECYERYGSPYKLDWLIEESAKKVSDGQKYFYENEYGYGDQIHPFSFG